MRGGLLGILLAYQFSLISPVKIACAEDFEHQSLYEGVGSCASSNCHGGVSPRKSTNILQNEYSTWKVKDAHSRAWSVLSNSDSQKIAEHLGIADASTSETCLACHSTKVEADLQGPKFRVEDGVGCESCHGASSKWLKAHTIKDANRKDLTKKGLISLNEPIQRAKVCLDCHAGTNNSKVDHRLIGSGHPRLTFELDTFSEITPPHWRIDEDYRSRKQTYPHEQYWIIGQAERSIRLIELMLDTPLDQAQDFSFSNCESCHHSLKDDQWKKRNYFGKPGTLPRNHSSFTILSVALKVLNPVLEIEFTNLYTSINNEISRTIEKSLLLELQSLLNQKVNPFLSTFFSNPETIKTKNRHLLNNLVKLGKSKNYIYYELAEQITMGISACMADLPKEKRINLKKLYKTLEHEETFQIEAFSSEFDRTFAGIHFK